MNSTHIEAKGPQGGRRALFSGAMLALLALAALPIGCGGGGAGDGDAGGTRGPGTPAPGAATANAPAGPLIAPARRGATAGLTVAEVATADGQIDVVLQLEAGAKPPRSAEGFNLCLPAGILPQIGIEEYRVGETVIWSTAADDATTATQAGLFTGDGALTAIAWKGYFRHWPIWRLEVQPRLWQPPLTAGVAAEQAMRVRLRIAWSGGAPPEPGGGEVHAAALEALAADLVVNPDDLKRWMVAAPPLKSGIVAKASGLRDLTATATHWARLRVTGEGLYRLTPEALEAAGFAGIEGRMEQVRVFSEGEAAPTAIFSRFGARSTNDLYFHAWTSRSEYDPGSVYWIAWDPAEAGPRMAEVEPELLEGTPEPLERVMREEVIDRHRAALTQQDRFLNIRNLQWLDRELDVNETLELGFDLFEPLPSDEQSSVTAVFEFATGEKTANENILTSYDPPGMHPYRIVLAAAGGAEELGSLRIDRPRRATLSAQLPMALLENGPTTLSLRLIDEQPPGEDAGAENSRIWFDLARIRYASRPLLRDGRLAIDGRSAPQATHYRMDLRPLGAFRNDVQGLAINARERRVALLPLEPFAATLIRNGQWRSEILRLANVEQPKLEPVVPDDGLLNLREPVDYLVLTHASLIGGIGPLVELNNSRGLRTRVVDVQSIYDEFNAGQLSPEAIRAYLAFWLRESPETAPSRVLLAGEATSDYLGSTRSDVMNLVPSYTYASGNDTWASDYWMTCVAGNDAFGDYEIGRLSVDSPAALAACLTKLKRYNQTPIGPWRARLGYVADNLEGFRSSAEIVRTQYTPPDYDDWRVYLDDVALEDDWYLPQSIFRRLWEEEDYWRKTSGEATNTIVDNLNRGCSLLTFFGHGSPNIWTTERIWLGYDSPNRDSQHLRSDGRYPFVVNYSCNTGVFDYPMRPYNICLSEDLMNAPDGGAIGMFVPTGPGETTEQRQLAAQIRRVLFDDRARTMGDVSLLTRLRNALAGNPEDYTYMYTLLGDPAQELHLTRERRAATLTPSPIRPGGEAVRATVDGVQPAEGKLVVWVRNAAGETLARGEEQAYRGGRVDVEVPLPDDVQGRQDLQVSIYGWNEQQRTDFLAGATLQVVQPAPDITAIEVAGETNLRFSVTVRNPGPVDTGPLPLSLARLSGGSMEILDNREIRLASGGEQVYSFETRAARSAGPQVFEARVRVPERLDALAEPADVERRAIVPPTQPWTGIVPEAGARVRSGELSLGRLQIVLIEAADRPAAEYQLALKAADGQIVTTAPVVFEEDAGVRRAEVEWDLESELARRVRVRRDAFPTTEQIALMRRSAGEAGLESIQTVPLTEIAVRQPRLRIVPESVAHEPERPTDGHTVWIDFKVENRGGVASATFFPKLFGQPPVQGAEPLPAQSLSNPSKAGPLGPGRTMRLRLRWDPIQNQGKQTVWIDLNSTGRRDENATKEQQFGHTLYVKTKSKPIIERSMWSTRDEEDRLSNSCHLHLVVANSGETDARAVEVSFYKTTVRRPEDLLETVLIDVLPARGKQEVSIRWHNFDPNSRPSAEVRLRGSQQRIFSGGSRIER